MKVDILEKGINEKNEKVYYLMVDFENGQDLKVFKLTEKELKNYAKVIYSKVDNLFN